MSAGTQRRDAFRAIADRIRAIPGRDFGLRPFRVWVQIKDWAGETGQGDAGVSELELFGGEGQPPKVREVNQETVALLQLQRGAFNVGPITPTFPGGGQSLDAITAAAAARGDEVLYRIVGPGTSPGGDMYRSAKSGTDRALRWMLTLEPVAAVQP